MPDNLAPASRRYAMSRVHSKNTSPEIFVRSLLHRHGFRFRLHPRNLPGNPDIVLPKYRTIIFVHGCFWHQHPGCRKATIPETNAAYWSKKFSRNLERDTNNQSELEAAGWRVFTLWTCEIGRKKTADLESRLITLLLGSDQASPIETTDDAKRNELDQ